MRSSDQDVLRAAALAEIEALARPAGVEPEVWDALKAQLARMVAQIEIVFGPPVHERSRAADITASHVDDGLRLDWAYTNNGDYDQNSEVNGADLVPMAPALYKRMGEALWARWRLADGDFNAEVNPADIAPLGASFRRSVEGYEVQYSADSAAGPYTSGARLPFSASQIPAGEFARRFVYALTDAPEGWYRVVPYFEDALGIESVAVHYNPPNATPVAVLDADWHAGFPPFTVRFDASASFDPDGEIVQYQWDLDGDGSFELDTGTDPETSHEYSSEGQTTVRLRVTDDRGKSSLGTLEIYAVDWRFVKLTDNGHIPHVAANNGRPVAAWDTADDWEQGPFRIQVACTDNPVPDDLTDFVISEIHAQDSVHHFNVASIAGRPAVLFTDGPWEDGPLTYRLALASNAMPGSALDWVITEVCDVPAKPPQVNAPGVGAEIAEVDGKPTIFLYNGREGIYQYYQAVTAAPTGPADWNVHEIGQYGTADPPAGFGRLTVLGETPTLCFTTGDHTELNLAQALSPLPASVIDWRISPVGGIVANDRIFGLRMLNDQPLIYILQPSTAAVTCLFSHTSEPQGPGDWVSLALPPAHATAVGGLAQHPMHVTVNSPEKTYMVNLLTEWKGELLASSREYSLPPLSPQPVMSFSTIENAESGFFISRYPANTPGGEVWLGLPSIPTP